MAHTNTRAHRIDIENCVKLHIECEGAGGSGRENPKANKTDFSIEAYGLKYKFLSSNEKQIVLDWYRYRYQTVCVCVYQNERICN